MESNFRRLISLSQRAEADSLFDEAEGYLNDALQAVTGPAYTVECYGLLAGFARRRGRSDEAEVIELLIGHIRESVTES